MNKGTTGTVTSTVSSAGEPKFTEILVYTVSTLTSGRNTRVVISTSTISAGPAAPKGASVPSASITPSTSGKTLGNGSSSTSGTAFPQSTSAVASSSGGFSAGSLAGAAVGCLIGGALIAFLIAFLIFRKRNQRKSNSGGYYQNNDSNSQNQRDVVAMAEKPSSKSAGAVMGWQAFLPQSADDRTIQNGVKDFFNLIELHVDNFYRKAPVELDQHTRDALAQIASDKLPGRIDQLMRDQRLVLPIIKHCITDLLITRMSPLRHPETSLLPSNLSAIPTKLESRSLSSSERSAASQAYSQWRLLNAYLYPHPEEDRDYIDDRETKANDIAEQLSKAFAPWQMQGENKGEMHQHEKGLVARARNLGILLMSQPSAFEFKWTADSTGKTSGRSLIVLPAFWKNTDEQGRQLIQPQLLVSPLILRV